MNDFYIEFGDNKFYYDVNMAEIYLWECFDLMSHEDITFTEAFAKVKENEL